MATKFEDAKLLSNKIAAQVKEQVWQLGRRSLPDSDFDEIFYSEYALKYGYDHYIKLSTLFFDARNGTTTLQEYNAAINRFINFNVPQQTKNKGVMDGPTWQALHDLVEATNVQLPEKGDITKGEQIIGSRKPLFLADSDSKAKRKDDRALHRSQQKTFRRILVAVTRLLNHVLDIYVAGSAANATSQQKLAAGALQGCAILKTLTGYPAGTCHLEMYKHMSGCIAKIIHE
jgi:hypothetical protein